MVCLLPPLRSSISCCCSYFRFDNWLLITKLLLLPLLFTTFILFMCVLCVGYCWRSLSQFSSDRLLASWLVFPSSESKIEMNCTSSHFFFFNCCHSAICARSLCIFFLYPSFWPSKKRKKGEKGRKNLVSI